jgi:hypothetical protein
MIAMIRINLLPAKRRGPSFRIGGQLVVFLVLLLVGEGIGLYLWQDELGRSLMVQEAKVTDLKGQVTELNQIKTRIGELEEAKKTLEQQNFIFDELKYDKIGPSLALMYLSYLLTPREDNVFNSEELQSQELNDWDVSWDPGRLWLTHFEEKDKEVEIVGHAIAHEDVTEFYRRLESSLFFYDIRPDTQEIKRNDALDMRYVEFNLECKLNYDTQGVPTPKSEVEAMKKAASEAAALSGAKGI